MPDPASKFENWLAKGDEDRAAIRLLLAQLLVLEPTLGGLQHDCVAISDYGVDIRYPDILVGDLETLAREAVAACDRICIAVRGQLPSAPPSAPGAALGQPAP
jgi:hypothetical protein